MTGAILVEVEFDDPSELIGIISDIEDALDASGVAYNNVKHWQREAVVLPTPPIGGPTQQPL